MHYNPGHFYMERQSSNCKNSMTTLRGLSCTSDPPIFWWILYVVAKYPSMETADFTWQLNYNFSRAQESNQSL